MRVCAAPFLPNFEKRIEYNNTYDRELRSSSKSDSLDSTTLTSPFVLPLPLSLSVFVQKKKKIFLDDDMDGGKPSLSLALSCASFVVAFLSPKATGRFGRASSLRISKRKKERKVLKKRQKRQKEKVQVIQFPKAKRLRRHISRLTSS